MHPEREVSVRATRTELARQDGRQRADVGDNAELVSCPICLMSLTFPVDTNCGHAFCAECILSYWQHDQWPQPARCAVCRSQVSVISLYMIVIKLIGDATAPVCCSLYTKP